MKKIQGEFWAIPKEIMTIKGLSLEARMVYAVLFTRQNGENLAWPGQKYVADILQISERSVRRYLSELVIHGLIVIHRRGLRKSNEYSLIGQVVRSRSAKLSGLDRTGLSGPIVREDGKRNIVREDGNNNSVIHRGVERLSSILKRTYGEKVETLGI